MTFKEFYDKFLLPAVKKLLPEVLKFLWKHLAIVITTVSAGGFVVETIYVAHVVSVADHATAVAGTDVANAKRDLDKALADLGLARIQLDASQATVASQQRTLTELQAKIGRLSQAGSGLAVVSGQIDLGQQTLDGLIDRSIQLTRLAEQQAQGPSGTGK